MTEVLLQKLKTMRCSFCESKDCSDQNSRCNVSIFNYINNLCCWNSFFVSLLDDRRRYLQHQLIRYNYSSNQQETNTWPHNLTKNTYTLWSISTVGCPFDHVDSYPSVILSSGGLLAGSTGNVYRTRANLFRNVTSRRINCRPWPNHQYHQLSESIIAFAAIHCLEKIFDWQTPNRAKYWSGSQWTVRFYIPSVRPPASW